MYSMRLRRTAVFGISMLSVPQFQSISGLGGHTTISGCRSLSKSFPNTVFAFAAVDNSKFTVGKKHICRLLIKRVGTFFYLQTKEVRVKTEAQYDG